MCREEEYGKRAENAMCQEYDVRQQALCVRKIKISRGIPKRGLRDIFYCRFMDKNELTQVRNRTIMAMSLT